MFSPIIVAVVSGLNVLIAATDMDGAQQYATEEACRARATEITQNILALNAIAPAGVKVTIRSATCSRK